MVGFPLVSVLGAKPTIGFGQLSSTIGIRDNPAQMQISVPIQRGNSDSRVFDQAGNSIGMVVAKLDVVVTGDHQSLRSIAAYEGVRIISVSGAVQTITI